MERFRLYGEIYCTCYELCDGDDPADLEGFRIDYVTDICEALDRDPDQEPVLVQMPDEQEEIALRGVEFDDLSGLLMIDVEGAKYPYQLPFDLTPSVTLQRVSDLLNTYAEAVKKEESV